MKNLTSENLENEIKSVNQKLDILKELLEHANNCKGLTINYDSSFLTGNSKYINEFCIDLKFKVAENTQLNHLIKEFNLVDKFCNDKGQLGICIFFTSIIKVKNKKFSAFSEDSLLILKCNMNYMNNTIIITDFIDYKKELEILNVPSKIIVKLDRSLIDWASKSGYKISFNEEVKNCRLAKLLALS